MTSKLILRAAFAVGAAVATPALATPSIGPASPCQLRMQVPAGNWIIDGYDAFDTNPATGAFDLILVNDGEGVCLARLETETDGEPFGLAVDNGRRVAYSLVEVESGADLTPATGASPAASSQRPISIGAHAQQLVRVALQAQPNFPGDGLFSQQLKIEAETPQGVPLAQQNVSVGVRILPAATMALSGAFQRVNGGADVDLGELTPGLAKVPLNLHVRSTRGYRITAASQNGGALRMADGTWSIPYRIDVGGKMLGPDGGSYSSTAADHWQADNLDLGFEIGDTAAHRAGRYSDVITLTIAVQ